MACTCPFVQQTSTMTAPMNITLQINQFCSCNGCLRKVKKALRKLDGAKLLAMDSDIGKFTISTIEHPEVVKRVFRHEFPRKNIIIQQQINNSLPMSTPDVSDIARTLVTMSQVEGVESVEYAQLIAVRFNFNSHHQPTLYSLPPTLHNLQGSNDAYHGHAQPPPPPTPPPPPPPPRQTYIKTSAPLPPPLPPPPQTYIRPSAPPMPPSPPPPPSHTYIRPSAPSIPPTPNLVYGYPQESHDFNYQQHNSCTIL